MEEWRRVQRSVRPADVAADLTSELVSDPPTHAASAKRSNSNSSSGTSATASVSTFASALRTATTITTRGGDDADGALGSNSFAGVRPSRPDAAARNLQRGRLCRHAFGPHGCALGALCPYRHASATQGQGAVGETAAVAAAVDEATDTVSTERAPRTASEPRNAIDAFEFAGDVIIRWFWRENSCKYSDEPLQWRSFSPEWETALEAAFRAQAGVGTATIRVAHRVDFENMSMCNVCDGGSRRAIQRVRCAVQPQWFLVDATRALRCSPQLCDRLEFEYVSGRASVFGVVADGRPLHINLFTMTARDPTEHTVLQLTRQPVSLQHAGPAASPHNVAILDQRVTFACFPSNERAYCVEEGAARLRHRELNPVVEAAFLNVSAAGAPPASVCEKAPRCWALASASHLWSATHPCPHGPAAACFMCDARTLARASSFSAAMSVTVDQASREPSVEAASPSSQLAPQRMMHIWAHRAKLHAQLFFHTTGGGARGADSLGGSGGAAAAETLRRGPSRPSRRTAELDSDIVAWRKQQTIARDARIRWEVMPPPPSRPEEPIENQQSGRAQRLDSAYFLASVLIGSVEGLGVLAWVIGEPLAAVAPHRSDAPPRELVAGRTPGDTSAMSLEVRKKLAHVLSFFPRVQRVQHPTFFERYLRTRNELHMKCHAHCPSSAANSAERIVFARLPRSKLLDALQCGLDRHTFSIHGLDAVDPDSASSEKSLDDGDVEEDGCVVAICVAYFPLVFEELPTASVIAETSSGGGDGHGSSSASPRVVPPVVPHAAVADATRECIFYDAVTRPEWGGRAVQIYDSCQLVPLYLLYLDGGDAARRHRVASARSSNDHDAPRLVHLLPHSPR